MRHGKRKRRGAGRDEHGREGGRAQNRAPGESRTHRPGGTCAAGCTCGCIVPASKLRARFHLQRVCGQPCQINWRGRSTIGFCTRRARKGSGTMCGNATRSGALNPAGDQLSGGVSALHAASTLPTVFPSLRAHELNPAGHAVHPGPGRRNSSFPSSAPGTVSYGRRKAQFPASLQTCACAHWSPRPAPGR